MTKGKKYTYVLYFVINHVQYDEETIHIGSSQDPIAVYKNAINSDNIEQENKSLVSAWNNLVETELSSIEKQDLEYAFMYNPQDEFSYPIKNMELIIKKVLCFD